MLDIYRYRERLEAARRRLASLQHGGLLLNFLDHLQALGFSTARVLKYVTSLCTIFKSVPFDPKMASRAYVERVVA